MLILRHRSAAAFLHSQDPKRKFAVRELKSTLPSRCRYQLDFTKIRSMGWGAADGISNDGVNRQIKVRAVRIEGIGDAHSQLTATLPPAMLANDNAWIKGFAEPRTGPHPAGRGADVNPIAILDSAGCGSHGIEFDLRVRCALAQTRQCTMLGLTKETGLGAG